MGPFRSGPPTDQTRRPNPGDTGTFDGQTADIHSNRPLPRFVRLHTSHHRSGKGHRGNGDRRQENGATSTAGKRTAGRRKRRRPALKALPEETAGIRVAAPQAEINQLTGPRENELPRINIQIHERRVRALVDTGAEGNFVRQGLCPQQRPEPTPGRTVRMACQGQTQEVCGSTELTFTHEDTHFRVKALIVPGLREEIILGQAWLQDEEAVIDVAHQCVHFGKTTRQ